VFRDLGDQALKNIARPVHVYSIVDDDEAGDIPRTRHQAPHASAASSKPSIAVLPFTNMSGDPGQQYFSDGITEDIITELSRFRDLFVIARHSCFQYRDKALDVKSVGRELGARFVLEGSFRRSGSRVRISAQLIDAETGNHLWANATTATWDMFILQEDKTYHRRDNLRLSTRPDATEDA
jgi:adenylate cyclase